MFDLRAQSLDDLPWWTEGIYRRAVVLLNKDGAAIGAMVDEQHHAVVRLTHDAGVITSIGGDLLRRPWSTCGGAPAALQHLVGLPLNGLAARVGMDRQQQCNHLFDVLLLLAAQIVRQEAERWYAVDIGRHPNGKFDRVVRLRSSTGYGLHWLIVSEDDPDSTQKTFDIPKDIIMGDGMFEGVIVAELPRHFPPELPDTAREALFVARRAVHVAARNRAEATVQSDRVADYQPPPSCFAHQPIRLADGIYVPGMLRDFTDNPNIVFDLRDELRSKMRLMSGQ